MSLKSFALVTLVVVTGLASGTGCGSSPAVLPPTDGLQEADGTEETSDLSEAEQLAADRDVMEQLRANGADLSLPTRIIHYLYFPTEAAAIAARQRVPQNLTAEVSNAEGEWELTASHTEVPSLDNIAGVRIVLMKIAADIGGAYDGWEAAVSQ